MSEKGCKYCGVGGWETLFRIIDSYPYGEPFEWSDECDDCKNHKRHCNSERCDSEDEDCGVCRLCKCDTCEYEPYQPETHFNLTVGVVGSRLMFEDKNDHRRHKRPQGKRYIAIRYCPMCGRELGGQNGN